MVTIKNAEIKIRISEIEKESIKERAELMQMSMSEYILYCIRIFEKEARKKEE